MTSFRRKIAAFMLMALLVCLCACGTQSPSPSIPKETVFSENPSVPAPTQGAEPTLQTQPPATTEPSATAEPPVTAEPPMTTEPPATTEPPVTAQPPATTEPPITTRPPVTSEPPATTQPPATTPEIPGGISQSVTVEAPGTLVKSCEKAVIDYSNTADGYVMVRYTAATTLRLKAQVKGPHTTYTYDLTPQKWAAFPLSDENGTYKITVFQNTTGSKYTTILSLTVNVAMKNEFAPFLHSNQYVDFDAAPNAVARAAQLTAGISDPIKKVEKIYDFVVNNISYDRDLADSVQSGYLPVLDTVLAKKTGICFDYAALMTGMLRSQGVPTKLVVGYAGTAYHAWISVWSERDGWVDGVIYFDGTSWKRMDPTFASSGGGSGDILAYIGDGKNYTPKYFY